MKRTAATLMLLAGLGSSGCMTADSQAQKAQQTVHAGGYGTVTRGKQINGVQGALGEPVMAVRNPAARAASPSGVMPAGGMNSLVGTQGFVRPVSGLSPEYVTSREGCTNCAVPGVGGQMIRESAYGADYGMPGPYGGSPLQQMPNTGILPVPGQGVPGAVAAYGAMLPGMHGGPGARPGVSSGRTSILFTGPEGMKVTWQLPDGNFIDDTRDGLIAPAPYNFLQGQIYRLRLSRVILPEQKGMRFYPTLEVAPASPKTLTFLAHSSVPLTFTPEDFAQAASGNLVVKVVYLPDPANQDFSTVIGAEEVVSTRLEPGADPVAEAQRRGTILAIIRMGNINLENPISPAMTAPPPGMVPPPGPPAGGMVPPPGFPPGVVPPKPKSDGGAKLPDVIPPIAPGGTSSTSIKQPKPLPPVSPSDVPLAPIGPSSSAKPKTK